MDSMPSSITEFQPPKGLLPHEAPFLLGDEDQKIRLFRAVLTAALELTDAGVLTLPAGARRPDAHRVEGVRLTSFHEATIASMTSAAVGSPAEAEALIVRRLVERGWCDPASGRLTPSGEEARVQLRGYRDYLRLAMADRLHAAAVEGSLDRETEFAAGTGVIGMPNLLRAISIRLGEVPAGAAGAAFAFLGGRVSEQHASAHPTRLRLAAFMAGSSLAFILAVLALLAFGFVAVAVVSAIVQGHVVVTVK